jgi:adenylate cyclase
LNRFAVRPLSSVKGYTETDQDPIKFGETLKVDAVLEGTLQTVENRLRVNMRLWDVRDGAQLWQDSFDSAEADFFNLQDAISTKVTQSLVSDLLEKDRQLLTKRYTDNPEAFRAYIRGRAIMDSKNPDNFEKALDEYEKAATLDPTFALAYVGFADAFTRLGFNSSGQESAEFYAKSKAAANKALALEPELSEAYAALGSVKRIYDWDWTGAEENFKRAIELNPNYAKAHLWYGLLLSTLGRNDEALAEIKRAIEIDPLSPDIKAGHVTILEGRREYAEALALARENVKFNKESGFGRRALAIFLFHQGEYTQVIEVCEQELPRKNSQKFVWLSLLATAYTKIGQSEKADENLKKLEELSQTDTKALYSLAQNYTERGRFDEALVVLQKCFEMREERMIWLKVEPRFANLRDNLRFQEILRKMNLTN